MNIWSSLTRFCFEPLCSVFNFHNKTDDVAVLLTKEDYDSCNTSSPIALYNSTPAVIILTKTGEYYFTSTYDYRCELGQKLAIKVTSSSGASPPSSTGSGPSSGSSAKPPSSHASGPGSSAPGPSNAAPTSRISGGYIFLVLLPMAMGVLHYWL